MDKPTRYDWTRCAIAIRKRTLYETRDLALLVIGKEFKRILRYYVVLAFPIFLFNVAFFFALICVFFPPRYFFEGYLTLEQTTFLFVVYITTMLEGSFAGSLVVQYLGSWLFASDSHSIDSRSVFASWRKQWKQLIYYLVLTRPIRFRAYYLETILLERTPFFRKSSRGVSTSSRVSNINKRGGRTGRIGTRLFTINGVLGGAFILGGIVSAIFPDVAPGLLFFDLIVFPLFALGCELYHVVFNFFSYINRRIVSEGWDLELAFSAELNKRVETDAESETVRGRFRTGGALRPLSMDRESGVVESLSLENAETNVAHCLQSQESPRQ